MPKQAKGLDHHLCVPKTNITFLAFSHPRDNNLTLSNNRETRVTPLLNSRLFRSFQTIHVHKSQISCRNERLALPWPVIKVNCNKWSEILLESTPTKPIHSRTCCHNDAKVVHVRNKCSVVSTWPHPETQKVVDVGITPRFARLAFVGKRSWISCQAKPETFRGTWWCQTRSKDVSIVVVTPFVSIS